VSRLAQKSPATITSALKEAGENPKPSAVSAEPFSAGPVRGKGIAFWPPLPGISSPGATGIELDAYERTSRPMLTKIIQGNCLGPFARLIRFIHLTKNPPYDLGTAFEPNSARERLEAVVAESHFSGGSFWAALLLLVIPASGRRSVRRFWPPTLSVGRIFRLWHPSIRSAVLIMLASGAPAASASNLLRSRVSARPVCRFTYARREYERLASCPSSARSHTPCRRPAPVTLTFKGCPLDELEDLIPSRWLPPGGKDLLRSQPYRRKASNALARTARWAWSRVPFHQRHLRIGRGTPHRGLEEQEKSRQSSLKKGGRTTIIRERERLCRNFRRVRSGETGTLEWSRFSQNRPSRRAGPAYADPRRRAGRRYQ